MSNDKKNPDYETLRMAVERVITGGPLKSESADAADGTPKLPLRQMWLALYEAEMASRIEPRTPQQRESHAAIVELLKHFHGSINAVIDLTMLQASGVPCWSTINKHFTYLRSHFIAAQTDERLPKELRDMIDPHVFDNGEMTRLRDMEKAAVAAGIEDRTHHKGPNYINLRKVGREALANFATTDDAGKKQLPVAGVAEAIRKIPAYSLTRDQDDARKRFLQHFEETLDRVIEECMLQMVGIGVSPKATYDVLCEQVGEYKERWVPEEIHAQIRETAMKMKAPEALEAVKAALADKGLEDRSALMNFRTGPDRASLVAAPSKAGRA